MEIFLSIEGRAARIPDTAEKLRFLRHSGARRRQSFARGRSFAAIAAATILLTLTKTGVPSEPAHPLPNPSAVAMHIPPGAPTNIPPPPTGPIWPVETHDTYISYSNGLHVRTEYTTHSHPREYRVYSVDRLEPSSRRTNPAGIVYHTTESLLLPLGPDQNSDLLRTREDVLRHIRNDGLYNFVIDRFGQVFRIVPEDEVAHHAGHSVWADSTGIYEGLNDSFLGVSFEARTAESIEPTPAQLRSARLLTEMLRATYQIPESNCVTHAQVSVNPINMRLGYHTDWAANFPFREMGFSTDISWGSTGYAMPIAAIQFFGFDYDQQFLSAIGGRPWEGLTAADQALIARAQSQSMSVRDYREHLQTLYRQLRSHLHEPITESPRT